MTDQEIEKLAGELAEAIAVAIKPVVKEAVEEGMKLPPRPILTVPKKQRG